MDNILTVLQMRLDTLLLIIVRVSGIMLLAPIFNQRGFSTLGKAGTSFFLALIVFFSLPAEKLPPVPSELFPYALTVVQEALLGVAIGFILQFVFSAIMIAGQMIDVQLGLGIVSVIDPLWGGQAPISGNFLQLLALLIFVIFDGHLLIVKALIESFHTIPITQALWGQVDAGAMADYMARVFSGVFLTGIQLAMPILAVTLITDFALAIVARTVPQLNIFVVGVPLKLLVGLAAMWVLIPFYLDALDKLFSIDFDQLSGFLRFFYPSTPQQ
ncbi:flagellar biosynthetic protein FliR [Heliophilum fasciatum]|uniref:Flagellar biosynthetic protein FliR n=1 Tax=Heliophilum fasciatum TaxID=35700 RepID=A0A4R2RMW2_9FIRM|nr:flagellar biosynthetic protein FliR [Heliophilum fasciatum]MCW2277927.1 flagellar biosynthetic protein FliR [Heliophilum fasciatum]TCP64503.1 flagellar biosynthetic protein FliR [Heliophilum fasciatum]